MPGRRWKRRRRSGSRSVSGRSARRPGITASWAEATDPRQAGAGRVGGGTRPLPCRFAMRTQLTALTAALLFAGLALALGGGPATGAPPPRAPIEFFGIGPQTPL